MRVDSRSSWKRSFFRAMFRVLGRFPCMFPMFRRFCRIEGRAMAGRFCGSSKTGVIPPPPPAEPVAAPRGQAAVSRALPHRRGAEHHRLDRARLVSQSPAAGKRMMNPGSRGSVFVV